MTAANHAVRCDSAPESDALHSALAAAGTGTWRWDAVTGRVRWDSTLEALCGLQPGQFGATFEAWLATLHPDERDDILALVQDALDRRGPYQFEHRTIWPDGTVHWLECRGEVIVDADGNPTGTVGCAVDITARKMAELRTNELLEDVRSAAERLTRLQRISQKLTTALTTGDVIDAVLDTLDAPRGATARGLWLVDAADEALFLAGEAGMKPDAAEMFQRIDLASDLPGAIAVRDRRTVVSPAQADSIERFPKLRDVPRTGQGFVAVPLVVERESLGVIAFGYDGPLEDSDVTFLEAAAGNVAQTLQRVRLTDALTRRSEEIAFLADITRAAITATDHHDLMQRIARATVPRLGDVCTIHFVPEPGARIEAVAAHADPARAKQAADLARQFPYDPAGEQGVARVLRTGEPEFIPDLTPDIIQSAATRHGTHNPDLGRTITELGLTSAITVPVRARDETIGALQILAGSSCASHTPRDLTLAQAVANGIGDALVSRWLTDQHRHIATSLQRAFLPPALPHIPGIDVAAAYWPAGEASEVGGDFYDLFAVGEHRWAVLIGDACGTGPDAAATAAIARHTARAAARHGFGHLQVLEWVNEAVKHSDRHLFCTACYATIDARPDDTFDVTIAIAGHPLPIVVGTDRAEAVGGPGTLLGVFDDPNFVVRRHTLAKGETIVFYTDGITDLPPPYGRCETELAEILKARPASTAADIVKIMRDDLDHRVSGNTRADDIAVLVIRNCANRS
jgi:serine phosphatase RsbU (regulator of sigma subunit)